MAYKIQFHKEEMKVYQLTRTKFPPKKKIVCSFQRILSVKGRIARILGKYLNPMLKLQDFGTLPVYLGLMKFVIHPLPY